MDNKRPLFPKFLSKVEHRFLLKQPELWATRIHLVIYYGLLFIVCLTALTFVAPMDPRKESDGPYWLMFMIIISIIFLVFWLIYLLRFNVFKRYGRISPLKTLLTFLCYFISAGVIVAFNYVQPYIESVRTNFSYGSKELVDDVNNMNIAINQLDYDSIDHYWEKDTIVVVDDDRGNNYDDMVAGVSQSHFRVTRTNFERNYADADSLVKANDSMYFTYKSPQYTFVQPYNLGDLDYGNVLNSSDIYRKYLVNYHSPADRSALKKQLDGLLYKYLSHADTINYNRYTSDDRPQIFNPNKKYYLDTVERSLTNIIEKKYRWSDYHLPGYISLFYNVTLIISLLVFVFRHSTTKTFFLSLLSAVIVSILTGLFMAFFGAGDLAFYGMLIFYTVLFFGVSLLISLSHVRNVVHGIALNLFTFIIAFLPSLIVSYYLRATRLMHSSAIAKFERDTSWYSEAARYGGGVLLLILIILYIHSAYRRWYSLPEE